MPAGDSIQASSASSASICSATARFSALPGIEVSLCLDEYGLHRSDREQNSEQSDHHHCSSGEVLRSEREERRPGVGRDAAWIWLQVGGEQQQSQSDARVEVAAAIRQPLRASEQRGTAPPEPADCVRPRVSMASAPPRQRSETVASLPGGAGRSGRGRGPSPAASRKTRLTMRSSPEWYARTAQRPAGARRASVCRRASSRISSSPFTSMRIAWNVLRAG